MVKKYLSPPLPRYGGPFQPGITDPVWDATPPAGVDADLYQKSYAGQLERQRHLHVITADAAAGSRAELRELLVRLSKFARHQMLKKPIQEDLRPYDPPILSRRVTVTVGFGATLFTTEQGDDRFGLAGQKPAWLKVMPPTEGDAPGFRPREHATDLIVIVSSDDTYVNEYVFGKIYYGGVHPKIAVRSVERGYARPDNREPSGFEDGLTNPRDLPPDYPMRHFVYVHDGDGEPAWCTGGTYLGYRKIARRTARFFKLKMREREAVFGTERLTGERLAKPNPHAHAPKINPRRDRPDLFGLMDTSRRFLRRPYFFNDGLDADGEEVRGLHHLSFVRNLAAQYEWPVHMWQMNPDFPTKGAGIDAIYGIGGAANIGGGYYFMPPAPATEDDYLASSLLD
ncbi:MAG TPA: Dyp-type peroxidase domain-containing protein [Pyrinomonadaceae bacterium]|jgi:deferrochelatase/peroxidase EfeB